jgi:hypothetical protein
VPIRKVHWIFWAFEEVPAIRLKKALPSCSKKEVPLVERVPVGGVVVEELAPQWETKC